MRYRGTLNYEDDDRMYVASLVLEGDQVRMSLKSHEWDEAPKGYCFDLPDVLAKRTGDGLYETERLTCLDISTMEQELVRIELQIFRGSSDTLDVDGRWISDRDWIFAGRLDSF